MLVKLSDPVTSAPTGPNVMLPLDPDKTFNEELLPEFAAKVKTVAFVVAVVQVLLIALVNVIERTVLLAPKLLVVARVMLPKVRSVALLDTNAALKLPTAPQEPLVPLLPVQVKDVWALAIRGIAKTRAARPADAR